MLQVKQQRLDSSKKTEFNLIVLPVNIIKEVPSPAVLGFQDDISGAYQLTGLLSSVLFRKSHYCRVYLAFIAGSSLEQTLSLLNLETPSSYLKWGFRKNWKL